MKLKERDYGVKKMDKKTNNGININSSIMNKKI